MIIAETIRFKHVRRKIGHILSNSKVALIRYADVIYSQTLAISFQCNQYLVRVIQLVSMDSAAMARWIFLKR